jgi:hypothetical protein
MNEHGYLCYTYYLYHVPTGKKYYGYRYANRCEPKQDLWNEYFSSSDLVEALIKDHGKESFTAEVRKVFDRYEEAHDYEQRFLRRVKAVEKDDWLNQAYMSGPHFRRDVSGENNPMFGRTGQTAPAFGRTGDKHPMFGKINPMQDKKHRKESLELIRLNHADVSGENNPMFGKVSAMKDKHHTDKTKKNISEKRLEWWKQNEGRFSGENNPNYGKGLHKNALLKLAKPVKTPFGIFNTITEAAQFENIDRRILSKLCTIPDSGYEFIK